MMPAAKPGIAATKQLTDSKSQITVPCRACRRHPAGWVVRTVVICKGETSGNRMIGFVGLEEDGLLIHLVKGPFIVLADNELVARVQAVCICFNMHLLTHFTYPEFSG